MDEGTVGSCQQGLHRSDTVLLKGLSQVRGIVALRIRHRMGVSFRVSGIQALTVSASMGLVGDLRSRKSSIEQVWAGLHQRDDQCGGDHPTKYLVPGSFSRHFPGQTTVHPTKTLVETQEQDGGDDRPRNVD